MIPFNKKWSINEFINELKKSKQQIVQIAVYDKDGDNITYDIDDDKIIATCNNCYRHVTSNLDTPLVIIESPTFYIHRFEIGHRFLSVIETQGFVIQILPHWLVMDYCKEGYCGDFKKGYCGDSLANFEDYPDKYHYLIEGAVEKRKKLSLIISERFKNISDKNINIYFDFERINSLREGCCPVIVDWNGQKGLKGYLIG